ncbi:MAG: DUF3153 domain-containing protein [Leptolyngbya sp. RL_3_1]|nr:DUF3153 domain-containing protein [Leptolyngbya sp. RL_3_1]
MVALLKGLSRAVVLFTLVLLTGCFQYDLDIQFDNQTHGQLVQHLHWAATLSPQQLQIWRDDWVSQVKAVGGQVRWVDATTVTVTVPFNNGAELEQRFNQLFGSAAGTTLTLPSGEAVTAALNLTQGNWIFAIHNHLVLSLDLSAIPTGKTVGAPILQGVELLSGHLKLTTPWGLNRRATGDGGGFRERLPERDQANQWPLHPGTVNQIEADFWVPSPIGIGAGAIALFVAMGYGLRDRLSPKVSPLDAGDHGH